MPKPHASPVTGAALRLNGKVWVDDVALLLAGDAALVLLLASGSILRRLLLLEADQREPTLPSVATMIAPYRLIASKLGDPVIASVITGVS